MTQTSGAPGFLGQFTLINEIIGDILMPKVPQKFFEQAEIEAISKALGDTSNGLNGSEIGFLLAQAKIKDIDPNNTKWKRLYNAFVESQNKGGNRTHILEFIRQTFNPQKYLQHPERFDELRNALNEALSFSGLEVDEGGNLNSSERVATLSEANERAKKLRAGLDSRKTHPEVLKYCKSELLDKNYFHAVLEAVKSIFDRTRTLTGLDDDGAKLIDAVFSGDAPVLIINNHNTQTEKKEQVGFSNLLKGIYGMFRTPLAHEAKISWNIELQDAEDLMSMVSMIHRRLDRAVKIK